MNMCIQVCKWCLNDVIHARNFSVSGAIFGDPNGIEGVQRVCIPTYSQKQVLEVQRKYDTPEKLAVGLLQLLFSAEELAQGNCTKPIRDDIVQLDSDKLWAIKCKHD